MGQLGLLIVALLRELPRGATVRSMAAEFGPPPAVYFAGDLAGLSDDDLIRGPQRRAPRRPPLPRGPDGVLPSKRILASTGVDLGRGRDR
jgi:hypothetical protein